jgi:ABC-2 type transport system ATP-binding protein
MDDIEALCSRVMVIGAGRILSDGTVADLRSRVTTERRLIIDLVEESPRFSVAGANLLLQEGNRVHLGFDPEQTPAADLIARVTADHPVRDLFVENPPIEEIIADLYREHGP